VHTRFPPEPNGYLHIGHAKSICLNFGLAAEFGGKTNLRFDDTNPEKEEQEYVDSIIDTVRWLGFDWEDRVFYASDYFGQIYEWALQLIRDGKAYVCDLSPKKSAGTAARSRSRALESPYRNRAVEENLDLFERMKAGEFPDGSRTLRAKIDMAAANLNLRDPVMYRILHAPRITAPATRGASIRCTISPTASRIPSRASRIPSARWSSRITGRSTTGTSSNWASIIRSRSNSTAST
jgi:glutaminyl-tRNA synthetase